MTKKVTKPNKKEEKEYRTLQFRITKDHELFDYCDTMCFNSKNLYNVTNFYVRQLMSGLKKDKSLRHENEKEIIQLIESQLPTLNQIREESYETSLEKWKAKGSDPKKEPKLYAVPAEIDKEVASVKLASMKLGLDVLTEEQREYLGV